MRLRSLSGRRVLGLPATDLALTALLMAAALAQAAGEPRLARDGGAIAASLLTCLPVAARRAAPLASAACLAAIVVVTDLAGAEPTDNAAASFAAVLVIAYSVGAHAEGARSTLGLACLLGAELAAVAQDDTVPSEWAPGVVVNVAIWFLGVLIRGSRGHASGLERHLVAVEHEAERREHEAAELERARIARELHDVIAHSVTLMTVQAGAADSVLDRDPESAREALRAAQDTGRRTIEDLRRLLGLLREVDAAGGAPEPSLDGLPALARQITAAGLPVELAIRGEPVAISPGLGASAYRIVQEGLTNALRHAHADRAEVVVAFEPAVLRLVISDDGDGANDAAAGGHGLVGMRERAAVFGGELEAAAGPRGGFVVTARFPLNGAAA
jgi:signal transduction histidine kinase